MSRLRRSRWFTVASLWSWLLAPVVTATAAFHAHADLDPCFVVVDAHDASQHRVESSGRRPAEPLDHCHACHSPRAHERVVQPGIADGLHSHRVEGGPALPGGYHPVRTLRGRSPPLGA
jgi:hypothetical protein